VRVLGWEGTVAAFCVVSVEQCVFISDVVFCFSGVCHIYVYIGGVGVCTSVVINRGFFLFFPCNHFMNIKKKLGKIQEKLC
jgi:hypothetical protein